ncbi:hypothetical protein K1719_025370 [Acacia pycnantha]|nr:hypothetical protein K1719_025370 [Acacia pycnantha]
MTELQHHGETQSGIKKLSSDGLPVTFSNHSLVLLATRILVPVNDIDISSSKLLLPLSLFTPGALCFPRLIVLRLTLISQTSGYKPVSLSYLSTKRSLNL